MVIKISVIGTAGRGDNILKLNSTNYAYMIEKTKQIIGQLTGQHVGQPMGQPEGYTGVTLVSGGAAWCDHIVVDLYNAGYVDNILLYLPCEYNMVAKTFENNKTGIISNKYHKLFSEKTNKDSLNDIHIAITKGAIINTLYRGFLKRNTMAAESDYVIAFTFGKDKPVDGGTKDKNKQCIHIQIPK